MKSYLRHLLLAVFLGVSVAQLVACSDKPKAVQVQKNSTVIALGDSLTFGYGTSPETSYPSVLAQKTQWNVVNAGINGDTSEGVLQRIDSIIEQNPKLVLLGIGGNDVLRQVDKNITKNNIIQIIQKLKAKNIPVVLIAEPHFSASALLGKASDNPIYEEIAEQENVPLFAKEWSRILSDKNLKSDQIHANTQGYAEFAENLVKFLQERGYY